MQADALMTSLARTGETMEKAADDGDWEAVARLHQSLHAGLLTLFSDPQTPGHPGTPGLLEWLRDLSDRIAGTATAQRERSLQEMRELRQQQAARAAYARQHAAVGDLTPA